MHVIVYTEGVSHFCEFIFRGILARPLLYQYVQSLSITSMDKESMDLDVGQLIKKRGRVRAVISRCIGMIESAVRNEDIEKLEFTLKSMIKASILRNLTKRSRK